MPIEITIPRLGWSMEEGVFGEWLKAPGERVQAGDMVFLLEGEKAAHEIESFDAGILCIPADAPQPGDSVVVGQVIGFLLAEGEAAPQSIGPWPATQVGSGGSKPSAPEITVPARQPAVAPPTVPRAAGPAARRLARKLGIDLNAVFTPDPTGRVRCEDVQQAASLRSVSANPPAQVATPRARRTARRLGIDWTQLTGTGRNGRVRESDVVAGRAGQQSTGGTTGPELVPIAPGRHVPASKLRRAIAQRMQLAVQQAVPVTLHTKVDAGPLVAFRNRLKTQWTSVPSYNDILIHLVASTLKNQPALNACWYRDGIHMYDVINVAMAVDTESGLLAPVIQNADQLGLEQIAAASADLVARSRTGQLSQDELERGTFTVTSLGMLGIDAFTPILNLPQAAILGVGRIVEEPVVQNSQLQIGQTLTLSLTFDHRVIDGAPAARWLQGLSERIRSIA